MNERIKEIRKQTGLSQKEFGKSIGLSESSISKIEKGSTVLTDRVINSIIREYAINETWLRTGKGTMKTTTKQQAEIESYLKDIKDGREPLLKNIILAYYKLTPPCRETLNKFIHELYLEQLQEQNTIDPQIEQEAQQYRETLYKQKEEHTQTVTA